MTPEPLPDTWRDVLQRLAAGFKLREIAAELGLTPSTVNARLYRIRRRLGARTSAHAVALAMAAGLLDPAGLRHSCARYELRRIILEFGHEHFGWPAPDNVDDELYDAAEYLAKRSLDYAAGLAASAPKPPEAGAKPA